MTRWWMVVVRAVVVMMVGAEEARGASRVGDENESVV